MFELLKKFFLPLWHASEALHTKFIRQYRGLRLCDLRSCLNASLAEGLSPGVTLFLPKKEYVSVSFFDFLFYPKGIINPGTELPLSTWSVIKRTRMGLTDRLKIGSIVRGREHKASFNREYITE